MPRSLIPVMAPHGSLRLDQANDDFVLESGLADRLEKSFERGSAHGLLHLGTSEAGSVLPASLAWWRDFGMRFIAELCALGDAKGPAGRTELAAPTSSELAALIDDAPPMRGGEYLRPDVLARHWGEIRQALEAELAESGLSLNEFLKARDPGWRLVGRVHFNLAENRPDPECPFAFMATHTSGLAASGALRHLPLGQVLTRVCGARTRQRVGARQGRRPSARPLWKRREGSGNRRRRDSQRRRPRGHGRRRPLGGRRAA